VVNQPLHDAYGCFLARPDLRIEHVLVEYDGSAHRELEQFDRDTPLFAASTSRSAGGRDCGGRDDGV
jgi:hypothetical protein